MSTFSPSLRIDLITTGDQAGEWGNTTNTNLGTLVESAITGYVSVSVTSANQALTAVDGLADQSRNMTIALTTTTGAAFNVYAPPAEKTYVIYNASAHAATLYNSTVLGNTTAAGAGTIIPAGKTITIWSDGTNFVFQNNHLSSLTLATDLAITDGGTGASTAADARTNLGLGTMATQAANSVSITGGSITGITDLAITDGGTGASTAADARTNLGAASSGANSDITSLTGLTTALSPAQGGTGLTSFTANGVVYASGTSALTTGAVLTFNGTNLGVIGATTTSTKKVTLATNYSWPLTEFHVVDFGIGSAWEAYGQEVVLGANIRINPSNFQPVYKGSSMGASQYAQVGGTHYWKTAPSGTGGAGMILSEQMRLSNTGLTVSGNTTGAALALTESSTTLTNKPTVSLVRSGTQINGTGNVGTVNFQFNGPGSIGTYQAAKFEVTARNSGGIAGQGRAVLAAGNSTGSYSNSIDVGGPTYQTLDLLGQDSINFYAGLGSASMDSSGNWVMDGNISGRSNLNVGPTTGNQLGSILGITKSTRLLGRYVAVPAVGSYYFDYNNSATVSTDDANAMVLITSRTDNTGYITEANAPLAFSTSYGNKSAGLGFISGTASDILKATVGLTPTDTAAVNAVLVGYAVNGPRILLQDRTLNSSDGTNPINYIAGRHVFSTSNGASETDGGLTITQTAVNVDVPLTVSGTIKNTVYTVGTLPSATAGTRAFVSDALSPTFLGAVTAGGAVMTPVFHNGTAWRVG